MASSHEARGRAFTTLLASYLVLFFAVALGAWRALERDSINGFAAVTLIVIAVLVVPDLVWFALASSTDTDLGYHIARLRANLATARQVVSSRSHGSSESAREEKLAREIQADVTRVQQIWQDIVLKYVATLAACMVAFGTLWFAGGRRRASGSESSSESQSRFVGGYYHGNSVMMEGGGPESEAPKNAASATSETTSAGEPPVAVNGAANGTSSTSSSTNAAASTSPNAGASTTPNAGASTTPNAGASTSPNAAATTSPNAGASTSPNAATTTTTNAGASKPSGSNISDGKPMLGICVDAYKAISDDGKDVDAVSKSATELLSDENTKTKLSETIEKIKSNANATTIFASIVDRLTRMKTNSDDTSGQNNDKPSNAAAEEATPTNGSAPANASAQATGSEKKDDEKQPNAVVEGAATQSGGSEEEPGKSQPDSNPESKPESQTDSKPESQSESQPDGAAEESKADGKDNETPNTSNGTQTPAGDAEPTDKESIGKALALFLEGCTAASNNTWPGVTAGNDAAPEAASAEAKDDEKVASQNAAASPDATSNGEAKDDEKVASPPNATSGEAKDKDDKEGAASPKVAEGGAPFIKLPSFKMPKILGKGKGPSVALALPGMHVFSEDHLKDVTTQVGAIMKEEDKSSDLDKLAKDVKGQDAAQRDDAAVRLALIAFIIKSVKKNMFSDPRKQLIADVIDPGKVSSGDGMAKSIIDVLGEHISLRNDEAAAPEEAADGDTGEAKEEGGKAEKEGESVLEGPTVNQYIEYVRHLATAQTLIPAKDTMSMFLHSYHRIHYALSGLPAASLDDAKKVSTFIYKPPEGVKSGIATSCAEFFEGFVVQRFGKNEADAYGESITWGLGVRPLREFDDSVPTAGPSDEVQSGQEEEKEDAMGKIDDAADTAAGVVDVADIVFEGGCGGADVDEVDSIMGYNMKGGGDEEGPGPSPDTPKEGDEKKAGNTAEAPSTPDNQPKPEGSNASNASTPKEGEEAPPSKSDATNLPNDSNAPTPTEYINFYKSDSEFVKIDELATWQVNVISLARGIVRSYTNLIKADNTDPDIKWLENGFRSLNEKISEGIYVSNRDDLRVPLLRLLLLAIKYKTFYDGLNKARANRDTEKWTDDQKAKLKEVKQQIRDVDTVEDKDFEATYLGEIHEYYGIKDDDGKAKEGFEAELMDLVWSQEKLPLDRASITFHRSKLFMDEEKKQPWQEKAIILASIIHYEYTKLMQTEDPPKAEYWLKRSKKFGHLYKKLHEKVVDGKGVKYRSDIMLPMIRVMFLAMQVTQFKKATNNAKLGKVEDFTEEQKKALKEVGPPINEALTLKSDETFMNKYCSWLYTFFHPPPAYGLLDTFLEEVGDFVESKEKLPLKEEPKQPEPGMLEKAMNSLGSLAAKVKAKLSSSQGVPESVVMMFPNVPAGKSNGEAGKAELKELASMLEQGAGPGEYIKMCNKLRGLVDKSQIEDPEEDAGDENGEADDTDDDEDGDKKSGAEAPTVAEAAAPASNSGSSGAGSGSGSGSSTGSSASSKGVDGAPAGGDQQPQGGDDKARSIIMGNMPLVMGIGIIIAIILVVSLVVKFETFVASRLEDAIESAAHLFTLQPALLRTSLASCTIGAASLLLW
jgi:hypothetical protein